MAANPTPASHRPPPDGGPAIDGLLVVNKPAGPTSHDVVAVVRRASGIRKVGHTGTLDPFAQGVLPLLLGRATRLAQFLTDVDKEYEADLHLGASTDTHDATGRIAEARTPGTSLAWPDLADVERTVAAFRGTYLQAPPSFSAKKVLGTPAYRLARRDRPVRLEPVQVTVHALDLLSFAGDRLRLRIVCSSGFYVRSLAHDIGERLGIGAYLDALTRTRNGDYTLDDASSLASLEHDPAATLARTIPVDQLLRGLTAVVLTPDGLIRAVKGNLIGSTHLMRPPPVEVTANVRLLDQGGRLVAIAQPTRERGVLHPGVVLG
jgi:tRNA pseudouridine55 synthase